ncbi:MAG: amidohydrolase family protein [Oscillospiraceae bacterium]|nr:amidohydrolase family protein [Oscillospiraceae bacterium]
MTAIINAELVMRDHLIPEAVLFIEGDKIVGFGERRTTPIPEGCEIIDAKGAYVGPGLVDIHCHSGTGVRFIHEPAKATIEHLDCGTTSILATPTTRGTLENYLAQIEGIRNAMATPEGATIAGIYMEGPFINPNFGSMANQKGVNVPRVFDPVPEDYEPLLEAGADIIRVWGTAPEREGIINFVKAAKSANPNVRFAVTHSEATPQQIEALMPYGLCIGTHHTNATGTIVNYPECRGVCVDEGVNYNSDIYAELISDSMGIHVDPYMQRLVRKIKGDDRIILISDQTIHDPIVIPGLEHVTDLNFTYRKDGQIDISGSKLTLNVACRNYMKHTGASIVDAFKVASYNPSKAVGLNDRGEIRVGLRADLVFVDIKMNVKTVILGGKVVRAY